MPWKSEETKFKIEKVKLAKRKWVAQIPLLETGIEERLENTQHLDVGDLAHLVMWRSVHSTGIPQLIPQKSSHGIMGQSGHPSSVLETLSHSLPCPPNAFGGAVTFPDPMSVLSQNGMLAVAGRRGSEVPRNVWLSEPIMLVLCCSQDLLWILEIIGTNIATWPVGRVWLFSRSLGKGKSDSCLCGCALRMLSLTWGPLSLEKHALPLNFCNPGDCLNHDGPL